MKPSRFLCVTPLFVVPVLLVRRHGNLPSVAGDAASAPTGTDLKSGDAPLM